MYSLDDLLRNLSITDLDFAKHRLHFAQTMQTRFSARNELDPLNMGRAEAESLFRLDRSEEGAARYQSLVNRFPQDVWAYIGWGDEYSPEFACAPIYIDPQRAVSIYRQALGKNLREENHVMDRIKIVEVWLNKADPPDSPRTE